MLYSSRTAEQKSTRTLDLKGQPIAAKFPSPISLGFRKYCQSSSDQAKDSRAPDVIFTVENHPSWAPFNVLTMLSRMKPSEQIPARTARSTYEWYWIIWLGAFLLFGIPPLSGAKSAATSELTRDHAPSLPIAATTLVEKRFVNIGKVGSNSVSVALEDLTNETSLGYLSNAPVGLVISIFLDSEEENDQPEEGQLARAICERVEKASHPVGVAVKNWIDHLRSSEPGDVVGIDLHLNASERAKFPVDRLIAVIFRKGNSSESAGFLKHSMANVLADAKHNGLAAIVVPCIGYRWDEKNSLEFDDLFGPLFNALDRSRQSLKVFISLYEMWPSMVIESAVRSINRAGATVVSPRVEQPSH
jgi:hypothetical protein